MSTPGTRDGSPKSVPLPCSREDDCLARYWRANLAVVGALLVVWAVSSLGLGIWWAEELSAYSLGGYPLGFWFAQQGSIVVFVLLILVYCVVMNALDRRHHRELARLREEGRRA